jgi:hypothetical protein
MKIPEQLKESHKKPNFRETQPMCVAYKLIDLDNPERKNLYQSVIVDVRVFWGKSTTCRSVVWINDPKGKRYGWGVGITSGSGYHHESAAIMDAFLDMGIKLESGEAFDGSGTGAQENAIVKLGEAMGYKNTMLVDFNP